MRFERQLKPRINVDLTPLIDVVFQLVIFFMISSVFKTAPGINLDLPQSATAQTVAVTDVRITLVSREEVYINRERTELAGVEQVMRRVASEAGAEKVRVMLEADRQTPYELVIGVIDGLRKNGIQAVSLVTRTRTVGQ